MSERTETKQVQTKEAMIEEVVKLLHTSSYPHVRAILSMLKTWNATKDTD